MNTNELRRLRFFEAIRFVIALAVCFAVLAWAAFTQGCASPGELPPGAIDFVTNYAQRVVVAVREQTKDPATWSSGAEAGASSGVAGSASSSTEEHGKDEEENPGSPSSSYSPVLDFRYGGFDGGRAKEDPRCRISNFKMGKSGCSLKWETAIPGDWARDKDGLVIAAIFYKDGDRWIGGKFDWIDRSRSTRDFENIDGGYGGWNASAFRAATKHAICVVSADGKYRSNLLEE